MTPPMNPRGKLCAAQRDAGDPKGSAASLRCRARLGHGPQKVRLNFLSSDTLREMREDVQSSISYAGGTKLADIRKVNYVPGWGQCG